MESNNNYDEESTNSSTDQEVVLDDRELGVGRSYECVFCKRGFNTAQALGGHMNIHRKDRARNNKPNSNKQFQEARLYHQIMPSSAATQSLNHRFLPPDPILSYATYFPEYSSTNNDYLDGDHDREASEEWRMSLSLEFPPAIMEDLEKKRRLAMTQEKDLDLELRLGYD